jgi:hypothetical protein
MQNHWSVTTRLWSAAGMTALWNGQTGLPVSQRGYALRSACKELATCHRRLVDTTVKFKKFFDGLPRLLRRVFSGKLRLSEGFSQTEERIPKSVKRAAFCLKQ